MNKKEKMNIFVKPDDAKPSYNKEKSQTHCV